VGGVAWIATRYPRIFIDHIYTPAVAAAAILLAILGVGYTGLQCGMRLIKPLVSDAKMNEAQAEIDYSLLVYWVTDGSLIAILIYLALLRWLANKIIEDQRTTTRRQTRK